MRALATVFTLVSLGCTTVLPGDLMATAGDAIVCSACVVEQQEDGGLRFETEEGGFFLWSSGFTDNAVKMGALVAAGAAVGGPAGAVVAPAGSALFDDVRAFLRDARDAPAGGSGSPGPSPGNPGGGPGRERATGPSTSEP